MSNATTEIKTLWGLHDAGLRAWLTVTGTVSNIDTPVAWPTRKAALEARDALMAKNPDHFRLQPAQLSA